MKKQILSYIFSLTLLFTVLPGCPESGSNTSEPSNTFDLNINVVFDQSPAVLSYEVWRGNSIDYDSGTIYAENLQQLKSLTSLNTGANSVGTLTNNQMDVLVVFGIDEDGPGSSSLYFFNEYKITSPSGTVTLTVDKDGFVSQ